MVSDFDPKLLGGAVGVTAILGIGAMTVLQNQHERELIAGGHCQKVLEALYTPPPTITTTCSPVGSSQICNSSYYQSPPYMRSLWRCADPGREGKGIEFWRSTAEEIGR